MCYAADIRYGGQLQPYEHTWTLHNTIPTAGEALHESIWQALLRRAMTACWRLSPLFFLFWLDPFCNFPQMNIKTRWSPACSENQISTALLCLSGIVYCYIPLLIKHDQMSKQPTKPNILSTCLAGIWSSALTSKTFHCLRFTFCQKQKLRITSLVRRLLLRFLLLTLAAICRYARTWLPACPGHPIAGQPLQFGVHTAVQRLDWETWVPLCQSALAVSDILAKNACLLLVQNPDVQNESGGITKEAKQTRTQSTNLTTAASINSVASSTCKWAEPVAWSATPFRTE